MYWMYTLAENKSWDWHINFRGRYVGGVGKFNLLRKLWSALRSEFLNVNLKFKSCVLNILQSWWWHGVQIISTLLGKNINCSSCPTWLVLVRFSLTDQPFAKAISITHISSTFQNFCCDIAEKNKKTLVLLAGIQI